MAASESPEETWGLQRSDLMPHLPPVSQVMLAAEGGRHGSRRHDDVAEAAKRLDEFAVSVARSVPWTASLIDSGRIATYGRHRIRLCLGVLPSDSESDTTEDSQADDTDADAQAPERRELRAMAHARRVWRAICPRSRLRGTDIVLGRIAGQLPRRG